MVTEDLSSELYLEISDVDPRMSSDLVKSTVLPLLDHIQYGVPYLEANKKVFAWLAKLSNQADPPEIITNDLTSWHMLDDLLDGSLPAGISGECTDVLAALAAKALIKSSMMGARSQQLIEESIDACEVKRLNYFFETKGAVKYHALFSVRALAIGYATATTLIGATR